METAKEKMIKAIQAQPDDSSYEEILKELAFNQMIARGLSDSQKGRVITHKELGEKIKSWDK